MQYKLTKAQFDALTEDQQKEYALDGESATLKIEGEGAPTLAAIAHADEKRLLSDKHRKTAEKARDTAESAADKLREDLKGASGTEAIAKINAEHQKELETIRAERAEDLKATKAKDDAALMKGQVDKFTNDNFKTPELFQSLYADRLSVEEVEGQSVIRVRDAEGKASVQSLAELNKEFLDNPTYKDHVKVNVGNGGGAAPGGGGGASSKSLSEMTATEQAKFEMDDPEGHAVAFTEAYGQV